MEMWVFITNEAFAFFLVFFLSLATKAIFYTPIHVDFLHKSNKHPPPLYKEVVKKVWLALPSFMGALGEAKEGMCASKISRWG